MLTDDGPLAIEVPRDREGSFEPRFIPKHERRFTGFDDKILALYARGMTVREIQGFLAEMYAVEVSPDLVSTVTDGIVADVTAWQSRPLERMYPVVFFDALRVKIRDEATVRSKAIYLALAVLPDGHRERPRPRPRRPRSMISNAVPGAGSFPPSSRRGGAPGRTSFRSLRFPRGSAG